MTVNPEHPVNLVLGAVDIYLSETDYKKFFVLTRRGEEE